MPLEYFVIVLISRISSMNHVGKFCSRVRNFMSVIFSFGGCSFCSSSSCSISAAEIWDLSSELSFFTNYGCMDSEYTIGSNI